MKLYFEEYPYPVDLLHENLGNEVNLSYLQGGSLAKVPYVGYYFNSNINDTVFILPKVFISESQQAFDRYNPIEIIDLSPYDNPLKAKADDEVVFELSAWLYQASSPIFHSSSRAVTTKYIGTRPLARCSLCSKTTGLTTWIFVIKGR